MDFKQQKKETKMTDSNEISCFLNSIVSLEAEQNKQIKRFTEVTKNLSKHSDTVSTVLSIYSKRDDTMTLESSKLVKELTGTIIENINEFAKYTKIDQNFEFGEKFNECKSSITSKLDKANVDISELIDRQQSLSIVHKNLKDDASDDNNSFEISGDFSD